MNVQSDSIASLTPQEVETIDFYTSSTPEMRLARRERFIKETNVIEVTHVIRSTVIVAASTIAGAAAGVVIGGGLGAAVGCGIGYAVPVIGVPKGARTGLKIGAGIGGCVGGVIGGHKGKKVAERSITLRITNAEGYKNWKARAIKERVYPLFKKKILDEPAMQDLYCSISGELPQIPVKTPCNHIFDRDSIVQWLRTKASTTRACPFRCEQQFGLNDLRYAPEHLRKIIDIAKEQISILTSSQQLESKEQAESKEQMESQVIIEGLTMILKDGILVSNEVLLQSAQNEARLARIHKLSKEEFRNAMDEFYDNQEFS